MLSSIKDLFEIWDYRFLVRFFNKVGCFFLVMFSFLSEVRIKGRF